MDVALVKAKIELLQTKAINHNFYIHNNNTISFFILKKKKFKT